MFKRGEVLDLAEKLWVQDVLGLRSLGEGTKPSNIEIEPSAFNGLDGVYYLDISKNRIKNIDQDIFKGLNCLTDRLDLSENEIESIEPNAFNGLNHLQDLDLRNNEIKILSIDGLKGLEKMLSLQLSDCEIESIESNAFNGLNDIKLHVSII